MHTQTSSALHNDTVSSCSTFNVQEKTQKDHSNPIRALNVDSLKVDSVFIQNPCSETEDSNSETASRKSVKDSSLDSATKDVHAIKYKMSKAKEICMTYFRSLNSHLQVLAKEDLKGTRIEHGFKRAFMSLFGQEADTFTSTMLLNVDLLQKQLDKDEFQEDGSMKAFWGVNNQFQKFIDSQVTLDYDSQMTDKYFVAYTGIEEVNSRAKIQSHKIKERNKPIDQKSHTQIPGRQIFTGYKFSPNKTSTVYEKISPRSDLRWKPTGRIFKSVGLRWLPTGKLLDSCTNKVESTSINVPKEQSLDVSAGILWNVNKENLRVWLLQKLISQKPLSKDGENLDKMKEKGDECIFVGYSTQSRAYRVFNKRTRVIMESIHVNFDELPLMASNQNSSDPAPECQTMASDQNSSDPAPEFLGKPILQPLRNQSVVRQLNAFKHERPPMSKQRFASQVDVNHNLSKPVTQYYLPKKSEFAFTKPDHMIASSSSRNSSKNMPRFSSNDMVHNHYLDEAKKKTQERDRNSKPSVMTPARFQSTTADSKPKPRSTINSSRSLPMLKSSCVTIPAMPKADHSKSPSTSINVPKEQSLDVSADQNSSDPSPECQTMASDQNSSDPAPEYRTVTTSNELDLLFSMMFDELLNGSSKVLSKSSTVSAADAQNQHQRQNHTTPLNIHTTPAPT
nr:Gag-Pol polyprotein [Tanacetum cinerariifolium]